MHCKILLLMLVLSVGCAGTSTNDIVRISGAALRLLCSLVGTGATTVEYHRVNGTMRATYERDAGVGEQCPTPRPPSPQGRP